MSEFDDQSARRISKTVRDHERRVRNGSPKRARWHGKGKFHLVYFELLEDLAQWAAAGIGVLAARRNWNPDLNGGYGGWETDCDDTFYVADYNEAGHNADAGGFGCADMRMRSIDKQMVGTIIDLCCPGDEQGECLGSGS